MNRKGGTLEFKSDTTFEKNDSAKTFALDL